jgi:hypothetical protein
MGEEKSEREAVEERWEREAGEGRRWERGGARGGGNRAGRRDFILSLRLRTIFPVCFACCISRNACR